MPKIKKFVICEAALHGDGEKDYYLYLIKALRSTWSGWPNIVFKLQHWCDPESQWALKVSAVHGRPPLKSVSVDDLVEIGMAAREAGFGYAVTFHDQNGLRNAFGGRIPPFTHIKLGSFDFSQKSMRLLAGGVCSQHNLGLIASVFGVSDITLESILQNEVFPKDTTFLLGEARYPSNKIMLSLKPIKAYSYGYSVHNVPSIAEGYVVSALYDGAQAIELHVTMRPYNMRPLPGDMCVSVDIDLFNKIALRCGETWAN